MAIKNVQAPHSAFFFLERIFSSLLLCVAFRLSSLCTFHLTQKNGKNWRKPCLFDLKGTQGCFLQWRAARKKADFGIRAKKVSLTFDVVSVSISSEKSITSGYLKTKQNIVSLFQSIRECALCYTKWSTRVHSCFGTACYVLFRCAPW